MNVFQSVTASVLASFLVACSLPTASGDVLERLNPLDGAARVELYALRPEPARLAPAGDRTREFHGYEVLGEAALTDPALATQLARLISRGVAENDGSAALCFNPRHGVRVVRDGHTLDLVICYECMQIYVYDPHVTNPNGFETWLTTQSVEPDVTRIFEGLGLTLAPN
ncbi:MAG: hypothetical protein JNN27_18135 [Planctomycetes bacterium]|nr:hypothetical protein [Planctomycetota bacterium]